MVIIYVAVVLLHLFEAVMLYLLISTTLCKRFSGTWAIYVLVMTAVRLLKYLFISQPDYIIYAVTILLDLLCVCVVFRGSVKAKLFFVLMFFALMLIGDAVTFACLALVKTMPFRELQAEDITDISMVLSRLILMMGVLVTRRCRSAIENISAKPGYAIPPLIAVCAVQFFLSPIRDSYHSNPLAVYAVYTAVFVLSLVFLYTTLIFRERKKRLEREFEHNRQMKDVHERYNKELYEKYREMSMVRHDAAALLRHYERIDDQEFASNLLSSLDRRFDITGSNELDIVLYSVIEEAKAKGVNVEIDADISDEFNWVKSVHFFTLMFNAVSNAVDALLEMPEDKREPITIKLKGSGIRLTIQVKNKTVQEHKKAAGIPILSEVGKSGHGVGMRNMLNVVSQYDGYMQYETQDGYFILSVMLQNGISDEAQEGCG